MTEDKGIKNIMDNFWSVYENEKDFGNPSINSSYQKDNRDTSHDKGYTIPHEDYKNNPAMERYDEAKETAFFARCMDLEKIHVPTEMLHILGIEQSQHFVKMKITFLSESDTLDDGRLALGGCAYLKITKPRNDEEGDTTELMRIKRSLENNPDIDRDTYLQSELSIAEFNVDYATEKIIKRGKGMFTPLPSFASVLGKLGITYQWEAEIGSERELYRDEGQDVVIGVSADENNIPFVYIRKKYTAKEWEALDKYSRNYIALRLNPATSDRLLDPNGDQYMTKQVGKTTVSLKHFQDPRGF